MPQGDQWNFDPEFRCPMYSLNDDFDFWIGDIPSRMIRTHMAENNKFFQQPMYTADIYNQGQGLLVAGDIAYISTPFHDEHFLIEIDESKFGKRKYHRGHRTIIEYTDFPKRLTVYPPINTFVSLLFKLVSFKINSLTHNISIARPNSF